MATVKFKKKRRVGLFCWLDQNKLQPTWTEAAGRQLHSLAEPQEGYAEGQVRKPRLWWPQNGLNQTHSQHFSWNFPNKDDHLLGGDSCVGAVPKEKERQRGSGGHAVTFEVRFESCRK